MKMICEIEITNGTNIYKKEMDSFVSNFMGLQRAAFIEGTASVKNTAGVTVSAGATSNASSLINVGWSALAADSDSSYGVVVGSGNNGVSITDHNLQNQITHGSGAGQLYYSATVVANPYNDVGTWSTTQISAITILSVTRQIFNTTTTTAVLQEAGIIVKTSSGDNVMIVRDSFAPYYIYPGVPCIVSFSIKITT